MNILLLGLLLCLSLGVVKGSGTVVVNAGNTLRVHTEPTTGSPVVYSLYNGTVIDIICWTTGPTISGTQGTTDQWDQILSASYGTGYASHAYIASNDKVSACNAPSDDAGDDVKGQVSVATGATLHVHSAATSSSTTLYSLRNEEVVQLTCVNHNGENIQGSQGTTSDWFEINGNGYASGAYIAATGTPITCASEPSPTDSTFQLALDYGKANLGTIYVGCAGGNYRFGLTAPYDMYHDGTVCGQSRIYFQPKGSKGFDCSGLMVSMFDAAGIYLPYQSSTSIKAYVPQVSKAQIKKGDMLAKSGHVVMWIGSGQVMESTPYSQSADTSWQGTRINSDAHYMDSSDYTAHRYPGLY